ncbi:glycosyltransferase family 4 protein [Planctomonas deserti]|uniref:glycosyltransferase family 4 protein n=1 Tax=Planctomonas deserti TaxID=2144185 RepID=UPI000D393A31|nr:glycosyltransferase family 4 protein [Planctomonas deserti]
MKNNRSPERSTEDTTRTVLVAHPSADLYGSDRVMLESVVGFVEAGARVVVTLPGPGPLVPEILARGASVQYSPTPVLRKSLLSPAAFLGLMVQAARDLVTSLRFLREVNPDVVYVSTVTIPLWILAARLGRKRSLCHVHEAEGSAPASVRWLLALPLLFADSIVTNSEYSKGVLTSSIPHLASRTTTIYNGVPGPAAATMARRSVNDRLRVVYVGRLSPRKGVDLLLAAVRTLKERGVPVHLSLVGAVFPGYEWYETQLHDTIAEGGLQDDVSFTGFVPSVWDALRDADVAVVPSRLDEPFGNAAVEAVLAARPVIVSNTSGLREAAAGYASATFVPAGDAESIADALQSVRENWDSERVAALLDSGIALERHSLQKYRHAVASAVLALKGVTVPPGTGPVAFQTAK